MGHIQRGTPVPLQEAWSLYRLQVCPNLPDGPAEFIRTAFFCGATALHSAQLSCSADEQGVKQMAGLIGEIETFMKVLLARAQAERASNMNTQGNA